MQGVWGEPLACYKGESLCKCVCLLHLHAAVTEPIWIKFLMEKINGGTNIKIKCSTFITLIILFASSPN